MGAIADLFGGSPKTSSAPTQQLKDDSEKAKKARTALIGTEAGVIGEELSDDSVKKRDTLLGN